MNVYLRYGQVLMLDGRIGTFICTSGQGNGDEWYIHVEIDGATFGTRAIRMGDGWKQR